MIVGGVQFDVTEVNRVDITQAICRLPVCDRVAKLMEMDVIFDSKPPEVTAMELREMEEVRAARARDREQRISQAREERDRDRASAEVEWAVHLAVQEATDLLRLDVLTARLPDVDAEDVRDMLRGGGSASLLCNFAELTTELNSSVTDASRARDRVLSLIAIIKHTDKFERLRWQRIAHDVADYDMQELEVLHRVLAPAWVECVSGHSESRAARDINPGDVIITDLPATVKSVQFDDLVHIQMVYDDGTVAKVEAERNQLFTVFCEPF